MKKIIIFVFIALVFTCSKPVKQVTSPITVSKISGTALWNRITHETNYKTYPFWPGQEGIRLGQSPHGVYHRIFINSVLYESLPVKNRIAPEGTIIVKENMDGNKKLNSITVMAKVKDFNPASGDWFWAKYSPKGKVLAEGTPKGCVSCHSGMKKNDYIIVRQLDSKISR